MQILLAEDDRFVLDFLESEVKKIYPDALIDKFWDGLSALEATRKKKYDLVITDIQMWRMCGDELARHISIESPDTQILFETCESERELKKRGIPLERCVFKPFIKGDLENKINMVMNAEKTEPIAEKTERKYKWFLNMRLKRT